MLCLSPNDISFFNTAPVTDEDTEVAQWEPVIHLTP